ncbi:hypothetical protein Q9233_003046 [Columba guinea]|nr:hypothetical protein Q9233_003046 [Columba guinea]
MYSKYHRQHHDGPTPVHNNHSVLYTPINSQSHVNGVEASHQHQHHHRHHLSALQQHHQQHPGDNNDCYWPINTHPSYSNHCLYINNYYSNTVSSAYRRTK